MRVALYVRRSTNDQLQADSLKAQEEVLRNFAAERSYDVVRVFADSASGRTVKKRLDFRALISMIERGESRFEAVLVRDVSRWGRFENADEAAYWEFFCITHGVRVIYVEEPFCDAEVSPYQTLMKAMKRVLAAEFSREKARITRYGQERVVRQGFMHGSSAPYGLRRTLVELDGSYVGELRRGDHKSLSNQRAKLAPGDPFEVETVRRVFRMYADGASTGTIARTLNLHKVPTPRAAPQWYASAIQSMLHNERYCGTAVYVKSRANDSPEVIRTRDAHEGIIDPDTWSAAQKRLASVTWKKSDARLAADLRSVFESWGVLDREMLRDSDVACWQTYIARFPSGAQGALELSYERVVLESKRELLRQLSEHVSVQEAGPDSWLVNRYLRIGFKVAFPLKAYRALRWRFEFAAEETDELTIGLGFSLPPDVRHVATFAFRPPMMRKRPVVRFIGIDDSQDKGIPPRIASPLHLAHVMTRSLGLRAELATIALRQAIQERPLLNLQELARHMGWTYHAVRRVFAKLKEREPGIATLLYQWGARVERVCPRCGDILKITPAEMRARRTDLCLDCYQAKRREENIVVPCTTCGVQRHMTRKQAALLSTTVCRNCHDGTPLREAPRRQRIEVACPNCGKVRLMTAWQLERRASLFCLPCYRKVSAQPRISVSCPRCQAVRHLRACEFERLSKGTDTPCLDCSRRIRKSRR
jgi:DNA invertase Pin-like site-specific DNA recombinase/phage FluMu protein Com